MKLLSTLCIAIAAIALSTSAVLARDGHYNSGLSISIGSHHNGLSLGYSNHNYRHKQHYYSHKPRIIHKHLRHSNDRHHTYGRTNRYNNRGLHLGSSHNKKYYQPKRHYRTPYNAYKPYSKRSNRHYSGYSYNKHYTQKACHPVTKIVTDRYGKYHSVGGTLCYDNYGQSYVVPGSRYSKY